MMPSSSHLEFTRVAMVTAIVIVCSVLMVHGNQYWAHFKNCSFIPGGLYCGDFPATFETGMPTVGRCLLTCRDHGNCDGVSYNPVENMCKGYKAPFHGAACASEWNTNYYIRAREYIGCYQDDTVTRAMGPLMDRRNDTTNDYCSSLCLYNSPNNVYFGTQNGTDCYCGGPHSSFDMYGRKDDSDCDVPCPGDSSQTCGAQRRNSVHRIFDLI